MTRRQPVQKRSRERVEQILLAAADQLAKTGKAEDLTTTSVSKGSGIPVATIYRYFANRMAIIAALIDREVAEIDAAAADAIERLETVTIASLHEAIMMAHLHHFQSRRRAIVLWFGARQAATVLDRVDRRYQRMAQWLAHATEVNGMLRDDVPPWGTGLIVWSSDRVFEFMFRVERGVDEERAIMREFIGMTCDYIENRYASQAGIEGVPGALFTERAGRFEAASAEPESETGES